MATATVYTRNNCTACTATKVTMDRLGIRYTEINVEDSPDIAWELVERGFRAMPVVVNLKGEWWAGFQKDKIESMVG